jgi:4-hydroxy 2-oxovalerate aldolase
MNVKVLDCTIRDGGHLHKWQFTPDCVRAAYFAAHKAGVDYFEAGYRYPASSAGLGAFGYSDDALLLDLLPRMEHLRLALMIDAGKCEHTQFGECRPEKTPVQVVRVAAYPYELVKATQTLEALHDKGYEVFFNLMASSELSEENYAYLRNWKRKDVLAAVAFADSFGSFIPQDISSIMKQLRAQGFERVAFHAHNNLQMAFANTLRAMEEGAACVDASIFGMGRGAGNLPIEILVGYLEKNGERGFNTVPYLDVIDRFFLDLHKKIGWGYGVESLMGGLANIHPYYVDALFKKKTYTVPEMWNALQIIKERCPISFSAGKLDEALGQRFYTPLSPDDSERAYREIHREIQVVPASDAAPAGEFKLAQAHKGRKFLVVGTGPSIVEHQHAIRAFAEREKCVTIGVNNLQGLFAPDYHLFVSRKRFQRYVKEISPRSILLVPSFFGREFVEQSYRGRYYFFDIEAPANPDRAPLEGSTQHLMGLNVAVSAMLLAQLMGAAEVDAVGMDGYASEMDKKLVYFYNEDSQIEEKEMANLRYELLVRELDRVNAFLQKAACPFFILTPTSHKKYYRAPKDFG